MVGLYIFIILIMRVVQSLFGKHSSNNVNNTVELVGFNLFQGVVAAIFGLLLIIFEGGSFKFDFLTVLIGTLNGLSLFLAGWFGLIALKSGTMSLSSIFGTAGTIIPIFASVFLFQEPVSYMQFVGLALFFVSAYLLIGESKNIYSNFNFKTLLVLIGSLVANGVTMLSQKMFTEYVPKGNVSVFSFLSYTIISVFLGAYYLIISKNDKADRKEKKTFLSKDLIICGASMSIATFIIGQLATISTALISPVMLFTFICGGGTIIATLVAAVFYKEKITVKTALGVIIGVISLVVIKLFE